MQYFGVDSNGFGPVSDASNSLLAYFGKPLSYVFVPLGFGNWKTAVSVITGLIAKENIVATLEMFGATNDFSGVAAFSFLVFNLLCAPCFAAIGAIRREMNSWKWTFFALGYQTVLAYAFSLVIYQFGMLFTGNFGAEGMLPSILGIAFASAVLIFGGYLLIRPNKNDVKIRK